MAKTAAATDAGQVRMSMIMTSKEKIGSLTRTLQIEYLLACRISEIGLLSLNAHAIVNIILDSVSIRFSLLFTAGELGRPQGRGKPRLCNEEVC